MVIRQRHHPRTAVERPQSRFFGSTFWQAYYVELTILGVVLCILTLRGLEYALARTSGDGHGDGAALPADGLASAPRSPGCRSAPSRTPSSSSRR